MCNCPKYIIDDDAARYRRQVIMRPPWQERTVCVDSCISSHIQALWDNGIRTTGCCCGHNIMRPWVSVPDEYLDVMKINYKARPLDANGHGANCFYL